MVFGELIFPLLSGIGDLIQSLLEVVIVYFQKVGLKIGIDIAKTKKEIKSIVGQDNEDNSRAIGFTAANEINFLENEEEEEDL